MDELHLRYQMILYTKDEEYALIKRAQGGDIEARNRLIENFMPAAHAFSKRYSKSKCFDNVDLAQEGVFGLIYAIKKFNPKYEVRFLSYIYFWFQSVMGRYVNRYRGAITLPGVLTNEDCKKMFTSGVQSLGEFQHALPSNEKLTFIEEYDNFEEIQLWLAKVKKWCNKRSFEIVELRLQGYTLDEVGEVLGITRERTRQLYEKAIKRIRKH